MPAKEDSKKNKSKILHSDELHRFLGSPQKKDEDQHKNVNLRDLSPYSPILRTIKKSFDHAHIPYDFAMIETPNVQKTSKSFLEEIANYVPEISKVLNWEQDDQEVSQQQSSPFGEISQEDISNCRQSDSLPKQQTPINPETPHNLGAKQGYPKAGQSQEKDNRKKQVKQKTFKRKPEPVIMNKKITCNCKKTQCLKLYCDCFRENQICGENCNCTGCHNTQQNEVERNNAMLSLMERNPQAFKPKLEAKQHAKGCNCRRSACLKKYCECFQAGLRCGEHCKCEECKNVGQLGEKDGKKNKNKSLNKSQIIY